MDSELEVTSPKRPKLSELSCSDERTTLVMAPEFQVISSGLSPKNGITEELIEFQSSSPKPSKLSVTDEIADLMVVSEYQTISSKPSELSVFKETLDLEVASVPKGISLKSPELSFKEETIDLETSSASPKPAELSVVDEPTLVVNSEFNMSSKPIMNETASSSVVVSEFQTDLTKPKDLEIASERKVSVESSLVYEKSSELSIMNEATFPNQSKLTLTNEEMGLVVAPEFKTTSPEPPSVADEATDLVTVSKFQEITDSKLKMPLELFHITDESTDLGEVSEIKISFPKSVVSECDVTSSEQSETPDLGEGSELKLKVPELVVSECDMTSSKQSETPDLGEDSELKVSSPKSVVSECDMTSSKQSETPDLGEDSELKVSSPKSVVSECDITSSEQSETVETNLGEASELKLKVPELVVSECDMTSSKQTETDLGEGSELKVSSPKLVVSECDMTSSKQTETDLGEGSELKVSSPKLVVSECDMTSSKQTETDLGEGSELKVSSPKLVVSECDVISSETTDLGVSESDGIPPTPSQINSDLLGLINHSGSSVVSYEDLSPLNSMYTTIKNMITNKSLIVEKIVKIKNVFLEKAYELKKLQKQKEYGSVEERLMFHGTKKVNLDNICQFNFNWRLFGTRRGHRFGKGVSFSTNAKYASEYSDDDTDKVIIMAKVLVAKTCAGDESMTLPPSGYDTTRKGDSDVVTVKYEDSEFYPAYILYYHFNSYFSFDDYSYWDHDDSDSDSY